MGEQEQKVAAELEVLDAKFRVPFSGVLERTARHMVRQAWYEEQKDKLIEVATDSLRAANLWDAHAGDYEAGSMRLEMMKRLLCAQGLLSDGGRDIGTVYLDAEQVERAAEAAAELERMVEARNKMLASASDEIEARRVYNSECWGPLSWEKLIDLETKLVAQSLIEDRDITGRARDGTKNTKTRCK